MERERVRCQRKMEGDLGEKAKPEALAPMVKAGDAPGLASGASAGRARCQPRGHFRVERKTDTKQAAAQARTSDSPCGTHRATPSPRLPDPGGKGQRGLPHSWEQAATAQNVSARVAFLRAALLKSAEADADLPLA